MALHIIAIAICKGEKLGYEWLFDVVGTQIFLNSKAVLTLKYTYIYAHVCTHTVEVVAEEKEQNFRFTDKILSH